MTTAWHYSANAILMLSSVSFLLGQNSRSLAPTPPMGWNSWDCYGPTVSETEVRSNADYMAEHLRAYGWEYIVVDIRWYVSNDKAHGYNEKDPRYVMDSLGRFLPSPVRFPSARDGHGFRALADYVHSRGLKFGIHVMRGIPVLAVRENTPILGTNRKAQDIYSPDGQCQWLRDMYTVVAGKAGAQEYYNSVMGLYASWGVDFVKVDDLSSPYHREEIEMIRTAIDRSGRDMVFSTSPGETPLACADHISAHANMWRIGGDFWDSWPQLKEHFELCSRWAPFIADGHFPDADMLPLGRIGIRAENGDDRLSKFSHDEQIALMSLFAIFRSPLMFGGDLPGNDAFTLGLLTNSEVLEISKHSKGNRELFRKDDIVAWSADDTRSGDKYVALFYTADRQQVVEEKALWKSNIVTSATEGQSVHVDVDIRSARELYLVVSEAINGNRWDHADWIEPRLAGPNGSLDLTDVPWKSATAGWGEARLNKSVAGNTLTLGGREYVRGIGTHATSVIAYDVPDGYTRFTAEAGLDRECIEHTEGASVRFLVFARDPSGPEIPDSAKVSIRLEQLGLRGSCRVRDIWNHKDLGEFTAEFAPYVRRHGAGLYRISAAR